MRDLSRRVAVTGVAETPHALARPDRTTAGLAIEACAAAIADAGLTKEEIDGVVIAEPYGWNNPRAHIELSEHLGIYAKRICTTVTMGEAAAGFCIELGRWAIAEGRCRHVLVAGAGKLGELSGGDVAHRLAGFRGYSSTYEHPFGPTAATFYAALARRHMHEFGTTTDQLAAIAVMARAHAARNPEAVMREPVTASEVRDSEPISDPLRLLDCAIASDGASAWILSGAAAARDMPHPVVEVLGCGVAQSSYEMALLARGDGDHDLVRTVGREAARAAFAEAGVGPGDIDVLEISDAFTIDLLMELEDYGFCEKGQGGELAASGELGPEGRLPTNTHGGSLSCAHFGTGAFPHHVEAIRQLRGHCGAQQVADARVAFASSSAGISSTHSVTILGRG